VLLADGSVDLRFVGEDSIRKLQFFCEDRCMSVEADHRSLNANAKRLEEHIVGILCYCVHESIHQSGYVLLE